MALIIETGSIVPNADSFITVAELTAYTAKRLVVLSATTDGHLESLIIKAMDFLESLESRMQGSRVDPTQTLSWPRSGVQLNGFDVPENAVPELLKKALCQLSTDADLFALMPTGDGREVIKKKVDVLETTYAETGAATPQPTLTAFYNILGPLLSSGGAFTLDMDRA